MAVIRPYVEAWRVDAQQLLDALPAPFDSGLTNLLVHSDDASLDG